jgi:hypothetical protein
MDRMMWELVRKVEIWKARRSCSRAHGMCPKSNPAHGFPALRASASASQPRRNRFGGTFER